MRNMGCIALNYSTTTRASFTFIGSMKDLNAKFISFQSVDLVLAPSSKVMIMDVGGVLLKNCHDYGGGISTAPVGFTTT